jgi:hypothetical protein
MRKLLGGGPRRSLLAIALVAAASGVTLMVPAAPAAAQSEPVNSCGPNISEYDPHPAGIYEEFNPEGRGWATLRYDPIAGGYEHVFYASGGGCGPATGSRWTGGTAAPSTTRAMPECHPATPPPTPRVSTGCLVARSGSAFITENGIARRPGGPSRNPRGRTRCNRWSEYRVSTDVRLADGRRS